MGLSAPLVAGCALLLAAPATGVGAPPPDAPTLRLRWDAPPSCPPAGDAKDLVESLTGARVVDGPAEADAEADVEVVPSGSGFAGRVSTRSADGAHDRELSATDCGTLSRALALVVAVSLDAVAVARRTSEAPEQVEPATPPAWVPEAEPGPSEPERPPDPLAEATPAPVVDRRATRPSRTDATPTRRTLPPGLEIGGRVGIGVGGLVLPGAGLGFTAGPYVGMRRFQVHVVGEYWTARTITTPDNANAGAELRLATGGVRGCGVLERGRVRVPLCAGVDAGGVIAGGTGASVTSRRSVTAPWAAVVLQPGVTLEVTPWMSLSLHFEGAISVYRPRFRLEGPGQPDELFVVGPFGPRGFFGIELHARKKP